MPDTTTIQSLPLMQPSQAQKHVTHNEALQLLDVMVQLSVANRTLSAPPASPATGDCHIVAAAPGGAWAGHGRQVAMWNGTAWEFHAPREGWRAYVASEGEIAVYDGVAWVTAADRPAEFPQLGVSATPDAVNRLTVSSAATLLNNAGAGHQLKINKAAAADTASLLFQTGYSGRAEMGTTGSDDFSIKVSADGTTFHDGLVIEKGTGKVKAPNGLEIVPAAGDMASPSNGDLWYNATAGKFRARQAGVTVDLLAAGTMDFPDAGFSLHDDLDATKQAQFQLSGITTGTTRTYTLPDVSSEIATLAGMQSFTGAKTFTGGISVTAGTASFSDTAFTLQDDVDPTKQAKFQLSGITTGTTQTYTLPNLSSALATTGNITQTFAGITTFAHPTVTVGNSAQASALGLGTGATTTGVTKTVNIGTGGLLGSTTSVSIGSTVSGALGTLAINTPTVTFASSVTAVSMASASVSALYLGLGGATADDTNRLSVNAPSVLLNHAGTSIEAVLNKNATANNANLSFKTASSTRAQVGLMGSDNLVLRVSPDGTSFTDALSADAATGSVTLAKPVRLTGQAGDPGSPVDGNLWYNSTTGQLKVRAGGEVRIVDGQRDVHWLTPVTGDYMLTTMGAGSTTGTLAGAASRIDLFPFTARADSAVSGLAVNCTAAVASALGKLVVYDSDSLGRPNALLLETADLDLSTTGVKTGAVSLMLRAGKTYWLGFRSSSTATISTWAPTATPDINGGTPVTAARKILRRTLAYTTTATSTWGFLSSEISSAAAPAIWLQV